MESDDIQVDERRLRSAYHILALDGMWQHQRDEMGDSKFERFIREEAKRLAKTLPEHASDKAVQKPEFNLADSYGITRKDLEACFDNFRIGNHDALNDILLGLINIDVPHDILKRMNSSEILGLYLGIGNFKKYGTMVARKDKALTREEILNKGFKEQISLLVSYGYRKYQGIRDMKGRGYTQHSTKKKGMQMRMDKVEEQARADFYESLTQDARVPAPIKRDRAYLIQLIEKKLHETYSRNTNK